MFPRFQPHLNRLFLAGGMILLLCIACKAEKPQQPALKTVFQDHFLIGAALNPAHVSGADPRGQALVRRHFNSITPENIVKWERIHPRPGRYHFEPVDSLVDFGEENGMFIVGHTLIWHSQTPAWVFEDSAGNPVSRDTLLQRMRDHIFAVVGRYKGRIQGWDVVNEGVEDDGTWRQTPWRQIIGEDYIAKAFEWAHQADPEAELYYNDFNMWMPGKRDWTVALVKDLKSRGLRIDGVGMQGHWGSDWP
ncbi:MAG TPA: endo-1,4-beta-xylanase, partial [Calditrichia bacterium]|nr:endo-1,4-beta-xylanase [Calditrichia bacterium]